MYDFNSFIDVLDDSCVVGVRIADDVLDVEDWGIDELTIKDKVVISQKSISNGVYTMPDMVGWDINRLIEWSCYDSTGRHPGQYNEISCEEVIQW